MPAALIPFGQFVTWRLIQRPGEPKPRKVPFDPKTGLPASVNDPGTWADHATAIAAHAAGGCNGIGFVFTESDPFVFVDLDDCADPTTGQWNAQAQAIMAALPGAWEVSQSGKGLHGVGRLLDPAQLAHKRRKFNGVEVYPHARFMAIGGGRWYGEPLHDWTAALAGWVPDAEKLTDFPAVDWADAPREGYDGPADDDELIRRATTGKTPLARMGLLAPFTALWTADGAILGQYWPDESRAFDHSGADLALCNALAWWTGCNPARMLRLFQRSALWRDDERKARLAIAKAIADPNRKYLSRTQRLKEDASIGDQAADLIPTILTIDEAKDDLVYVGHGSAVVSRRSKRSRNYTDAVREYAASQHTVDTGRIDDNGRSITKDVPVLPLWLKAPDRISVDVVTWDPSAGEFCSPPEKTNAGGRAYNMWTGLNLSPPPDNWRERAKPFVDHIAYLVPDDADRWRFTCWLAHIFQQPGVLPHTSYLMVAEKHGTGRGTLCSILTRALAGHVAANVTTDALFGDFNGRLAGKLLATVDEVREGMSSDRHNKANTLRSKATEEFREINPKYGMRTVERNCCRWLYCSNHLDALPFDDEDRRLIVIENPKSAAGAEWFDFLHAEMADPDFIASVQHYLLTFDLAGYNAHEPAPLSPMKQRALAMMRSGAEHAVREFARRWPGDFATLADLRVFIGEENGCSDAALRQYIAKAGMSSGKTRIKFGPTPQTVLVVRGAITASDLDDGMKPEIKAAIEASRASFDG
ncbi:DUF5906 domain-containing protein [Novosphingobium sp. HII-3]|uniref:phage NrS-1 polymerase family protein n=1 Tax=Novosphingobium sp. HII-3 TaxID=2075565 RepID=UPI0011AF4CB8|nr:DUF5906 domain-containing protein [Novosphingobium sp. HII-3]